MGQNNDCSEYIYTVYLTWALIHFQSILPFLLLLISPLFKHLNYVTPMPICCFFIFFFFTTWRRVKNDSVLILGWTVSSKRACGSLSLRLTLVTIVKWTGTCRIPLRRPTNPPVAQEWCVWCWSMPAQILGGLLVVQSALVSSLYYSILRMLATLQSLRKCDE